MKRGLTIITAVVLFMFIGVWALIPELSNETENERIAKNPKIENKATTQADRAEYFHRMLRDPKLGSIPPDARARDLAFVKNYDNLESAKFKTNINGFEWKEVGPFDVGGRTRAFGIDKRDNNILIAGAASGGIWKSTNGGSSWELKSDLAAHLGVTAIQQHPLSPDTWYYSTGEFSGSAGATGATYFGSGIFQSNDNGETWEQIESTRDDDISFNSQYDFISNIAISPTTGSIFYASNALGVFRSTNGLSSSPRVLGETNQQIWADVAVNSKGDIIAVLSSAFSGVDQTQNPGVYISTNDGVTWIDITPGSYPNNPERGVIGTSESDPNIFYVLTDTGLGAEGLDLHRFDITDPNSVVTSERSSGIPNFGDPVGDLDPQGGYNLVCKVHPTNSNIVFIGGTNLFRSTDGFSTVPPNTGGFTDIDEAPKYWIGGYDTDNNISQYPAHHPDQHNLIFDPTNPNRAFSLHDGGISVTNNITALSVNWTDIDDGYNVTQFYGVSIHPNTGDGRILGGTQDNGTPFFTFDFDGASSSSSDESSGDGSFSNLGVNYAITSAQNGYLLRYDYSSSLLVNFSYVAPLNAENQSFIHPFAVNPTDENYVFYPQDGFFWRNDQMTTLPRNTSNSNGTTDGWTELNNVNVGTGEHIITALAFSNSNPTNRLYYAGSDFFEDTPPVLRRFDNLDALDGESTLSSPGGNISGANVNDIAVNPNDGDEVITVYSNYGINSIWYSSNAGLSWTSIGSDLGSEEGPSIRAAAFAPTASNGNFVFIGTSAGLYVTDNIDGANTVWTRAAEETVANSIVSDIEYRISDEVLAVATHGRGLFVGKIGVSVSNELMDNLDAPSEFNLNQNFPNPFNPSTNIEFTLAFNAQVNLTVFDINGREVASIYNQQTMSAGNYSATFDASSLASGTYLYRMEAIPIQGGTPFTQSRTMTLIK